MRNFQDLGINIENSWFVRPYSEFHATNDGPKKNKIFELDYDSCPKNIGLYIKVVRSISGSLIPESTKGELIQK